MYVFSLFTVAFSEKGASSDAKKRLANKGLSCSSFTVESRVILDT